jgi:hypothetical protein
MGLFDQMSVDGKSGLQTFTKEAKAFATLDLNTIFKDATAAAISFVANAVKFFKDVFGHSNCNDQDRILVERLYDQIPGMIVVLVKQGYMDHTLLDGYHDNPLNADYGGRPHGSEPCNSLINPARSLFTVLFGVRIWNSYYLDALDNSIDAYYRVDNGVMTSDIPRAAVERAVFLKQHFYPISTYNTKLWDLQHFQDMPLVAPIPDPNVVGQLYNGDIFGITVKNGVLVGTILPDMKPGTDSTSIETTAKNFIDTAITFVKENPVESAVLGGLIIYITYELVKNLNNGKKH